ncbi:MAG: crosslink repair DNA glycosylase YcaQ family protein [Ilumatobacteraceae bacterium]
MQRSRPVELVLTAPQARRLALSAQLLAAPRPTDLVDTVAQLGFLKIDPTAAIAPSADLVAWSRLGNVYRPEALRHALDAERSLFEYNAVIYPMTDLPLYVSAADGWSPADSRWSPRARAWVTANESFHRYVLAELDRTGPITAGELDDLATVPWQSTGWTNARNVTQMLEFLAAMGEVAVAGREGPQRLWDLAERVYPSHPRLAAHEVAQRRAHQRLRALGIARPKAVGDVGVPATVDGVSGVWRVDPAQLERPFEGRTALVSPFDRFVTDRARLLDLFGFEYILEMYKPANDRRWGYFALPAVVDDQLVGKVDAKADRQRGELRLHAIHLEAHATRDDLDEVEAECEALADWLGLHLTDQR